MPESLARDLGNGARDEPVNGTVPPHLKVTLLLDQDLPCRVHRALFRSDPPPDTLTYLREWPHALCGSGTARRRCDSVRDSVTPEGLIVAALVASLIEPATYWPDLDLARVTFGGDRR